MIRQAIIQAGGKGTRLEQYTRNRPKCLVPVDGKPLLAHTMAAFPDAIIAVVLDYRSDVVIRWCNAFPPAPHRFVITHKPGTAAGIAEAAATLPYPDEPVVVVWCDLVLPAVPEVDCSAGPVVFTTTDFPCRIALDGAGVMGLFMFPNPGILRSAPESGEFTDWLMAGHFQVKSANLPGAADYGSLAELEHHWSDTPARFFNEVTIDGDVVTKRARLPEYESKIADEVAWYNKVHGPRFGNVPTVLATSPLRLIRISGQHPWQMRPDTRVMAMIMDTLDRLHGLETHEADPAAVYEMYCKKTIDRTLSLRLLLPEPLRSSDVTVNGRVVSNLIYWEASDWDELRKHLVDTRDFTLIHGDLTFSNILITRHGFPFLIDPRGRFGDVQFFGDPLYDWAKLWYSVVGGYDNFNRKQFVLEIGDGTVDVAIKPSPWRHLAPMIEERLGPDNMRKVKIIHALIWLSLVGYVADDYDAMLAAYFNGLLLLEEAL